MKRFLYFLPIIVALIQSNIYSADPKNPPHLINSTKIKIENKTNLKVIPTYSAMELRDTEYTEHDLQNVRMSGNKDRFLTGPHQRFFKEVPEEDLKVFKESKLILRPNESKDAYTDNIYSKIKSMYALDEKGRKSNVIQFYDQLPLKNDDKFEVSEIKDELHLKKVE